MPSEYDFLSPYSRRLRRAGLAVIGVGAFLAGAVAMAAIVALPLFPLNGQETAAAPDRKTAASVQEPVREPEKAVSVTATTPSTAAQANDAATTSLQEVPDTGAGRQTTGLAGANPPSASGTSPGAKPEAAPLPASSHDGTSAVTQSSPPVPTGQKPKSEASVPRAAETTPSAASAIAEPPARAADGSEASAKPKKPTASRTRRIQRERAAYRQRHEQRSTRAASRERRAGREYVDGNGVRYYVVPRSAESAFAYDDGAPRGRRVIIVRPGPFDDD